jgi:predicted N-acetyltransferase YhbS
MIHYRELQASDLSGLSSIDRSDYSSTWCEVEDGKVVLRKREFRHVGFSRAQWDRMAEEWKEMLARGAMLIFGAYDGPKMVGAAGLDTGTRYGPEGRLYNFGPIWVSREYRGRGIGSHLFEIVCRVARGMDIDGLYISATPVPSTVGFYRGMGCRLLKAPDPRLHAEEPEDIHMYLDLSPGPQGMDSGVMDV